jgi:superfamily II DNA/RNA helicase
LFEKYPDIPEQLKKNLISYKFPEPTPIQMQSIPVMLKNRDLIASAQTGSG